MVVDPKEVKDLSNGMVDEIVNGLWVKIEGRDRRKQDGPHPACPNHQFKVTLMEWSFTNTKNKFSFFLQCHIGRSDQEILIIGVCNSGKASNGTGDDHHPL
jgi:hypothetical protein